MIWKLLLWISHHPLLLALVWAFWVLLSGASKRRLAEDLSDGRIEFRPKKIAPVAWLLIVVFLAYEATESFLHSQWKVLNIANSAFLGFFALAFLCSFPGTAGGPLKPSVGLSGVAC